jgi:eukaryotic-like serine/threonine-protein kinase
MSDEIGRRGGSKQFGDSLLAARETAKRDTPELYEFGPFRLEPNERKLLRGNEIVELTPKTFDTLVLLVRNSGHLLEKEELISMLWPDTFVEEGSLSNNIFLLRRALGEDPPYIETVPKRGYRFVGAVRQLPVAPPNRPEKPGGPREISDEVSTDRRAPDHLVAATPSSARRPWGRPAAIAAVFLVMLAVGMALLSRRGTRVPERSQWVQLTELPDAAVQPALSPDGRMLAFLRGWSGQVYVKILPDGDPVQLTHDDLVKFTPAFSPDGSRVAYTTMDQQAHWDTWVVPTLGGEPQPFLRNASGLTWTGPHRVLFSEIKAGVHMGIVAADESRMGAHDIYLPDAEPAMAHNSYLSPDGKWVLIVEMDQDHLWLPCRVVPADGSSSGRHVGPLGGGCTSAAWSRDGHWMYFTANPGGANHIWRQPFPNGEPQQITFGPTEEQGIAMASDGHSFVTAVGLQNVSLWIHDTKGERPISLEGNIAKAKFTPDGKRICYLTVKEADDSFTNSLRWYRNPGELRIADLASGRSEPFIRDFPVLDYDISADGTQVVLSTTDSAGKPQLWLAPLDRSASPAQIPHEEGNSPRFLPGGDILFRRVEQTSTFVYRVHADGTALRKARPEPIFLLWYASPDGRWFSAWAPNPGNTSASIQLFPLDGGPPIPTGGNFTIIRWSLDGRAVLIPGSQTYLVPLPSGEGIPRIRPGRFASVEDVARVPGARRIDGWDIVPGPSPDVYAFHRGTIQQNLYRIPIP